MPKPQAAVIHKIDRTDANTATLDNIAVTLNQPTPTPTPPKPSGLIAILLAAVDPKACYGVALFDTRGNAMAASGTFSNFWRTTANLGSTAVHEPVVAAAAVSTALGAAVNPVAPAGDLVAEGVPDARMVWVPLPVPVTVKVLGALVAGIQLVERALLDAIRRIQKT